MPDVTVYGTTWCSDCRRSKALLHELGVEYEWVDISEEPDAAAIVMKINEGRAIVPTILFADGSHLAEPSNPELENKIHELSLAPSRPESRNSP